MITEHSPTEQGIAERIHALSMEAYAVEAALIGCDDFPPLRETLDDLRKSSERFLIYRRSGEILGALSTEPGTAPVMIARLVVRPSHFRQGIAKALLADLQRRLPAGANLAVTTASQNRPAVMFYQSLGFSITGQSRSAEGIPLIHFAKENRPLKAEPSGDPPPGEPP